MSGGVGAKGFLCVTSHPLADHRCRQRFAEQEALYIAAAFAPENVELIEFLHPFRQRFHPQRISQRRDRANNGMAIAAIGKIGDERPVDFHFVEGEGAQIAQRRIACPEIVQRNLYAQIAQTMECRHCLFDVRDENAFGNLQLETVW